MALSFEESKKKLMQQAATSMMASLPTDNTGIMTVAADDNIGVAAYTEWTKSDKYVWNDQYTDDKISRVDQNKNITVDASQINITQEENSQYIPFEMPRYYDGFDLTTTTISFHYLTSDGYHGESAPINVSYDTATIKFGWLIDGNVTHISGNVKFEIRAIGVNANGNAYVWKSRAYDKLNVIQSLIDDSVIQLDDSWVQELVTSVAENVAEQIAEVQVAGQVAAAEAAAVKAEAAYANTRTAVDDALENYYTKPEVDTAVANVKVDLTGYATENYVREQIDAIPDVDLSGYALKTEIPTNVSAFTNDAGYLIEHQSLDGLATETYVREEIDKVDVSEQLKDYAKKTDLNDLATEAWVEEKIADADISDKLTNYTTHAELEQAIAEVDVSEQLQGYAKKEAVYDKATVDSKDNIIQSGVTSNTQKITDLSTVVTNLQQQMSQIKVDQKYTYDVAYNNAEDPDVGENVFVLYEIENEGLSTEIKTPKQKFTIVGGGIGATSSTLKIEYITTTPVIATLQDKVVLKYKFTGTDSSGDKVMEGDATWKVGGRIVTTGIAVYGENEFDITQYLTLGTQKVNLTITDAAGSLVTKTWTVQRVDIRLESSFNDELTYPLGTISFDYTPYGAVSKTIHFKLDGNEIGTVVSSSSGIPMSYSLPAQDHGAHLVEAYVTATINNNEIESNHIYKDVIWYDENSDVPVIGTTYQNFTARQYEATNIKYVVYDPTTETPIVSRAIDGVVINSGTMTSNKDIWQYKTDDIGQHTLTITCGSTVKTLSATIEKLDIDVQPVTSGLVFDFNPTGKSNTDVDRLWSYGEDDAKVSMIVSENFDWVNGGYQIDGNGDQYFCVKAGTKAFINHKLFANDPKKTGKEFKVVFKTTNVKKRDTSFITCMDNGIGLDMKVESANIYSSNANLYSPYCEDDVIEFEFNINKDTDIPMVLTYEDGVANRPMIYTSDASFMQNNAQVITIGSSDCDVYVYRMKAYSTSLTDGGILSNFIADARNADEMIDRYNRNQIYDENKMLTPEVLAEKCPDLRIIKIDAPWFTNDKSNKVEDTNITMIYKNGDPILDNWTCTGASHSGQGTSSNEYGYAGRNMDLIMDGKSALFTLGDGVTTSKTITLTRNSTPTDYLNVKVNVASSENQNNAQMAMRFNEYQPYKRTARLRDPKIRDCMEFYNCVVFVRERNEDISTHREFTDTNYHYYALGNVGDSKKTDDTRVNDKNDPKECCIEIMDYNVALAEFPTGYTDAEGNKAICPENEWKKGNPAYDYLYADYKYKDGEFKSFGSESYEFRYEKKGITSEERQANIDSWREAYKFIVTSNDETFKSDFNKYFVQDSILYFYLFTERYTMVDNRAKNCFVHKGKVWYTTEEASEFKAQFNVEIPEEYIDDTQANFNSGYRWDLTWGYDFDTCLGIDNTGKLVITYGKEDVDYYVDGDPSSAYIYRAADSTFFCRVRDLFSSELQAMFVDRESANAWNSDGLINQWDAAQSQFPEEIWRLDIQRKYLRTYQGISIDNSIAGTANPRFLTEMLNGRKRYQRRMFERNQELYFATKYFGNKATQDQIMMRFNNPVSAVVPQDFTMYLTPYSDMYVGVKFGNVAPTNFRAKAGVQYTIPYGIAADTADITLIYGASFIQAIGDLSKCYVGDNDFSKASRLQSLIIGSDVDGYTNNYMTKITLGNNKLLEYLDIRNVTGINSVVDLSQCNNLLELHAENSGATGVIFANGGKLQKAYIPAVVSLTVKNLNDLEVFDIEGCDNLQTLVVENTPFINTYDVINNSDNLTTVRLIGLNWDSNYSIAEPSIFSRLLTLRGVDSESYEIPTSVISGHAHVAVMREKLLADYNNAWPDLSFTYNTLVQQFTVTFMNDDGTILDVQYVDKGTCAVDPITRIDNPIAVPTKTSTVSTDYIFVGWDKEIVSAFDNQIITATYSESIREYTVKYVSKNTTIQETVAKYGTTVLYDGEIPTYTLEEPAYKYYLFDRWDNSGYVNGDKTINAIFDSCEYKSGYFEGKDLSDMRIVEIYMMLQLNKIGVINISDYIKAKDSVQIRLGNDFSYSDVEEKVLIDRETVFDGTNYVDTGVTPLSEDRDFVFAIDYSMTDGNSSGSVLAQCFSGRDTSGFKLSYNGEVKLYWGSSSTTPSYINSREMVVIRHIKGDNGLYVYSSNTSETTTSYIKLDGIHDMMHNVSLVFGCSKLEDGTYEQYGKGTVYWSKLWYADLGESVCEKIACWPHEEVGFEACCEINGALKRYYLSQSSGLSSVTFVASNVLSQPMNINNTSTTTGGWAAFSLNNYLNTRVYEAFPDNWKQLVKQVIVKSSAGNKSADIVQSDCYIFIPSISELGENTAVEPYASEGTQISHITTQPSRICDDKNYWTRSPNFNWTNYMYSITPKGSSQVITQTTSKCYIRLMMSI